VFEHLKQCTYNITQAHSRNNYCSGKAISITYSESVFVALAIQHAMCMPDIVLSFVACLAVTYFFLHHPKNGMIFGKEFLNMKRVF